MALFEIDRFVYALPKKLEAKRLNMNKNINISKTKFILFYKYL